MIWYYFYEGTVRVRVPSKILSYEGIYY